MAHLTNFSFEFFHKIFTEDAPLPLLYHSAKKSKMTKNSNQGGSCLKVVIVSLISISEACGKHSLCKCSVEWRWRKWESHRWSGIWCLSYSYRNNLNMKCDVFKKRLVHGTCYMVHGTWYMVHGTWYMVHVGKSFRKRDGLGRSAKCLASSTNNDCHTPCDHVRSALALFASKKGLVAKLC